MVPRVAADRFVNRLPFPPFGQTGRDVLRGLAVAQLRTELTETVPTRRVDLAACEGLRDGAAGFACVRAVAEAAPFGQRRDLGEDLIERVFAGPKLQLAHAGSVDD